MTEWFRRDNTEGYSDETLKVMNEKMDRIFANLDEEERENKSYRFIPTHVGNTRALRCCQPAWPVHPHACGEHSRR